MDINTFSIYVHDGQTYGYVRGMGNMHDCRTKCALGPCCEMLLDDELETPCKDTDLYLVKLEDPENEN